MKAIIKKADIVKYTAIGGNVDIDKFLPCVIDAQVTDLEPILGETLFKKIYDDYNADSLSGLYLTLYEDYIKPFLIHASAKNYFIFGAYQINNGGIMKHTTENSESLSKSEIDYLLNYQKGKCDVYSQRMTKWLCLNNIEEYYANNKIVKKNKVNFTNWHLGNE